VNLVIILKEDLKYKSNKTPNRIYHIAPLFTTFYHFSIKVPRFCYKATEMTKKTPLNKTISSVYPLKETTGILWNL